MLKSLHEYRHGRYEPSLEAARESRRRFTSRPIFKASNHAIEAMAHFRLGQLDEARQSLGDMEGIVNEKMPTLESGRIDVKGQAHSWYNWLVAHILRREAMRLMQR